MNSIDIIKTNTGYRVENCEEGFEAWGSKFEDNKEISVEELFALYSQQVYHMYVTQRTKKPKSVVEEEVEISIPIIESLLLAHLSSEEFEKKKVYLGQEIEEKYLTDMWEGFVSSFK